MRKYAAVFWRRGCHEHLCRRFHRARWVGDVVPMAPSNNHHRDGHDLLFARAK